MSMRNKQKEIFKDISGYEGLYQVSNYGNIKSLERRVFHPRHGSIAIKEKLRIFTKHKTGHLQVTLSFEGVNKIFKVSKLVAKVFIKNPNNLNNVNHKDSNNSNNNVNNLEWVTMRDVAIMIQQKINNTSKYNGVYFDKYRKVFRAMICINGKQKYLGAFIEEEKANEAYQKEYVLKSNKNDTKYKLNCILSECNN